jgi:hypothetical protein
MTTEMTPVTTTIRDFLGAAMALAQAGYIDDVLYLWAAYSVREGWVAGLSIEDRAEFLNFHDVFLNSVATTTLGSANGDERFCGGCGKNHAGRLCPLDVIDEPEEQEHLVSAYDFDEAESFLVEVDLFDPINQDDK